MSPKRFIIFSLLLIASVVQVFAQDNKKPAPPPKTAPSPQSVNAQGISIQFSVAPRSRRVTAPGLMAGEEGQVGFKISGTNGSAPLSNLRPVAWIDQRPGKDPSDAKECREKVQAFLQASFAKRPTLDLNAYFILTLNDEPNISVLDPLSGFGGSKLYNLIPLAASGEDWVMSTDQTRLYVSMPSVNQVAVIDIPTWKPIANIDAGMNPTRVALQHDGRYLWVGNNG